MCSSLKRGFTILEILVVIAIIGIMATVAIAMLADVRKGASNAAFKQEADALVPLLVSICHDRDIVEADVPSGSTYDSFTIAGGMLCGPTSPVIFSIEITPNNGATCTSATLTSSGVTYSPSGC